MSKVIFYYFSKKKKNKLFFTTYFYVQLSFLDLSTIFCSRNLNQPPFFFHQRINNLTQSFTNFFVQKHTKKIQVIDPYNPIFYPTYFKGVLVLVQ